MDYNPARFLGLVLCAALLFTTYANAAIFQSYDTNWIDTFADNDYTNNPAWTTAASWVASSGYLVSNNATETEIGTPNTGQKHLSDINAYFETKFYRANANRALMLLSNTATYQGGTDYRVTCNTTNGCKLERYTGGVVAMIAYTGTFPGSQWNTVRVERRTDGNWLLYLNSTLLGSATDTTSLDVNHIFFNSFDSAGASFDDVNFGKMSLVTETPSYDINLNVYNYYPGFTGHAQNYNMDCNDNTYDANRNSPATISMVQGHYLCTFNDTGWDTNANVFIDVSAAASKTIYLKDTTTPTIGQANTYGAFTINGNDIWGTGNITATISDAGSDINSTPTCEYTTNNGVNWYAADGNATHCYKTGITIAAGTDYNFILRGHDKANNLGTGTVRSYRADSTAPTVGQTQTTGFTIYTTYIKGNGTPSATITDATSGIKAASCRYTTNNGTSWASADQNATHCYKAITAVNGTTYRLNFDVNDNANNTGTGTATAATYTGDTLAPVTTTTATQNYNATSTQIRFTCTDAGAGCKSTAYQVDGGSWAYAANTGTYDVNITGPGSHTLLYLSSDNLDNNETQNSLTFSTYGFLHVTLFDENTNVVLAAVNLQADTNYSGSQIDKNLGGITAAQWTLIYSKTGYPTRQYVIDLNQYSDINLQLTLLPASLGYDTNFTFYGPDESTLLPNWYVEIRRTTQNYKSTERRQLDGSSSRNFFLNTADGNYTFRLTNGTTTYNYSTLYDYNAAVTTLFKPKDEETNQIIDANWNYSISGVAIINDTNIQAGSKTLALYANTKEYYRIKVSSNSTTPTYFTRTYFVRLLGDTSTYSLQPYLVNEANGLLTTIKTISAYTNQPIPDVDIKIYTNVIGVGLTLVDSINTDAKGEGLALMILNNTYDFEIYQSGVYVRTDSITATSTTIYIRLSDINTTAPSLGSSRVTIRFLPDRGKLLASDTNLTQTITVTDYGNSITVSRVRVWVTNTDFNGVTGNDVNVYYADFNTTSTSISYGVAINSTTKHINGTTDYDNNGYLVVYVEVTTSEGVVLQKFTYKPVTAFQVAQVFGFDLRPVFGCTVTQDPNTPCPSMLLAALFIALIATIGLAVETGFSSMEGFAGIFLVICGIFSYLAWIPPLIFGLMLVGVIVVYLGVGGRRY